MRAGLVLNEMTTDKRFCNTMLQNYIPVMIGAKRFQRIFLGRAWAGTVGVVICTVH